MPVIDYKELLIKYIKHINECDGGTYCVVRGIEARHKPPNFTNEEWNELQTLDSNDVE